MSKRFLPFHDWNNVIEKSVFNVAAGIHPATGYVCSLTCFVLPDSAFSSTNETNFYLIAPCRRETLTPALSRMELFYAHRAFKLPEKSSMLKAIRQSLGDTSVPLESKKKLELLSCSEYAAMY